MVGTLLLVHTPVIAQQAVQFTVLPFVQPNGVVDLSLAGRWQQGNRFGALNTQFQTVPGMPFRVGSASSQVRTFSRQNVPFFSRTPFVGGLFRNQSRWQQTTHSRFNVTATPVDPAGNPLYRGGSRVPIPKMYGLIPPQSPPRP